MRSAYKKGSSREREFSMKTGTCGFADDAIQLSTWPGRFTLEYWRVCEWSSSKLRSPRVKYTCTHTTVGFKKMSLLQYDGSSRQGCSGLGQPHPCSGDGV